MAGNSETDRELQAIHKELRELNRRLDRICRASIFSLDPPVIKHKAMFEELTPEEEESIFKFMNEKFTKITKPIMEGEEP